MQCAIDNAKRTFDVNIGSEIKRIKKDIDVEHNKYPAFWLGIRRDFNKKKINWDLNCPMNHVYSIKLPSYKPKTSTIQMDEFIQIFQYKSNIALAKKIQEMIHKYSLDLFNFNLNKDEDGYILLRSDFEDMVEDIRQMTISKKNVPIMSWLLNRAFHVTKWSNKDKIKNKLDKNKSLLIKVLYRVNPDALLECFSKNLVNNKTFEDKLK